MTYDRILILIGIAIGAILLKKTKPNILKGILIGLILSIVVTFFKNEYLTNISFLSFGILTFIFSLLSGINKKWINLIIGLFAFASFFFKIMNYPYVNELKLLMLIPILSYIIIFRKLELYKSELSVLTILFTYELSEFLKFTELWMN